MRIAVLWSGLSGYLNACLHALAAEPGVSLFVAHMPIVSEAPFNESEFAWIPERFEWRSASDAGSLQVRLEAFAPDLILVAGWHVPIYRLVLPRWKGRAVRLMAMDNAWRGTLKQQLGAMVAPWHVLPLADAAFVPGNRQHRFASHLGFKKIHEGSLSCDYQAFHQVFLDRAAGGEQLPEAFVYVGRLAENKGIRTLLAAYARYRAQSTQPWPLIVAGAGPLEALFTGQHRLEGVEFRGFTHPGKLPSLLREAGCQLVPSHFEPWGIVVHEAASAGLAVIATTAVGASDHLIEEGRNGFLIPPGDSASLADALLRIETLWPAHAMEFSLHSARLAERITPLGWAKQLVTLACPASGARAGQRL